VESNVRVFVDQSHFYSFEQISSPGSDTLFKKTKDGHLNFGYTSASIWCKLQAVHMVGNQPLFLKFNNPLLDIVDIYLVDSEGKLVKKTLSGSLKGSKTMEHKGSGLLFDLPFEKDKSYDLYFRLEGKNILIPMLEIGTLPYFFDNDLIAFFYNGTFYGVLVGLIVYSLFLFFFKKSIGALFCGMFILFIGILDALLGGYFELLFPFLDPGKLNETILFVLGFSYLSLLIFNYYFFRPVLKQKLDKALIYSSAMGIILLFISFWFLDFHLLVLSSWMVTFFFPVFVCSYIAIKQLVRGYRPARFIVVGLGVLVVGLTFYLLTVSGLIDYKSYKLIGTHLALAIESLFFVLSINDRENWDSTPKSAARIEVLRQVKENQQLQSELTKQQIKLYKSVLEAQEKERARIAKDLHDGIGQTLAAVKMIFGQLMYTVPEIQNSPSAKNSMDLIDGACTEIREISHQMMPINLIKFGLKAGLEELLEKTYKGSQIKFEYQISLVNER
ncbi:MAG: hypothetical protein K2Q22_15680, partial [Cytophagales bacterium]|nr:hypothetical protein [Cytophagales bacterium]